MGKSDGTGKGAPGFAKPWEAQGLELRVLGRILTGVGVLGQAQALGHFLLLIWTSFGFYSSSPS